MSLESFPCSPLSGATPDPDPRPESDATSWEPLRARNAKNDEIAFVVCGRSTPFAPWPQLEQSPARGSPKHMPAISFWDCSDGLEDAISRVIPSKHPWHLRCFKISLSKLVESSGWFQEWSLLSAVGPGHFVFEVVDLNAFSILIDIFHGKLEAVPATVSLELLAKISALVDELKCRDALGDLPEKWMNELWRAEPLFLATSRDLVLWMHVALTFQDHKKLNAIKNRVLLQSTGSFDCLGLSIDEGVICDINGKRSCVLRKIFRALHSFLGRLRKGNTPFSSLYEATLLGILHKQLPLQYFVPEIAAPDVPISISQVVDGIFRLGAPHWDGSVADADSNVKKSDTSGDAATLVTRDSNGFHSLFKSIQVELEAIQNQDFDL
ncbi:hypothetical protein O1611_g4991 [Lasiodiplodia mahajangana]|uniref:Uncharacterized protein n=1 Tax=Lasiodiplodia mahajangana TaxID=1108764 RepID=A0ACC2JMS7_9PEZI|nr:hypothetical protein O1611_g4991 [Lasiodiplodia mahajangana]